MAKAATQLAYSCDLKGPEGGGAWELNSYYYLRHVPSFYSPHYQQHPGARGPKT